MLLGWGSVVTRLFGLSLPGAQLTFSQIWLGLALLLLLLQLVNFFAPLTWLVTAILAAGGLLALWLNRRRLARPSPSWRGLGYGLLVLLTASWLAMQSMQPPTLYDTGLYHLQSIRWQNEYALVPGLGNLHGRLALNSSFFAFAAALNLYPYFGHGYALANGFLILLLAAECWHALIWRRSEHPLANFAALLLLPWLAYMVLRQNPASPAPATASSVLQLLLWLYFARLLEEPWSSRSAYARTHTLFILAALAITIQQSNLVFALTMLLLVYMIGWLNEAHPLLLRLIILFRLSWLPLLLLVVWIGRGYFLSGYPLYPSTVGGIQVDWAVPLGTVIREARAITLATRAVSSLEEVNGLAWVGPWLLSLTTSEERIAVGYPLALTLLLAAGYGLVRWFSRARQQPQGARRTMPSPLQPPYALLSAPIILGLLAWWATAPNPQLVHSLFWLLPMLLVYRLLERLKQAGWGRPRINQTVAFGLVNLPILLSLAIFWSQFATLPSGFGSPPTPQLVSQRVQRRLSIWMPVDGDLCWDAQLPCSPYVNPQLRRRGADIQHGFRIVSQFPEIIAMN